MALALAALLEAALAEAALVEVLVLPSRLVEPGFPIKPTGQRPGGLLKDESSGWVTSHPLKLCSRRAHCAGAAVQRSYRNQEVTFFKWEKWHPNFSYHAC